MPQACVSLSDMIRHHPHMLGHRMDGQILKKLTVSNSLVVPRIVYGFHLASHIYLSHIIGFLPIQNNGPPMHIMCSIHCTLWDSFQCCLLLQHIAALSIVCVTDERVHYKCGPLVRVIWTLMSELYELELAGVTCAKDIGVSSTRIWSKLYVLEFDGVG